MNKRIGLVLLVGALLLAPACESQDRPSERLRRLISATEQSVREFTYVEQSEAAVSVVKGEFEDDMRYHATFEIAPPSTTSKSFFKEPEESAQGSANVLEQVISDDALAIRVTDPSKLPFLANAQTVVGSRVISDALLSGTWVLDYQGAPPLLAPTTREGSIAVGDRPVLDAYYYFQYLERVVEEGRVIDFNPDRIDYNPRDDPFPHPDEDLGVTRYDVLPPDLPRRSQRGTEQALTTVAHFRKVAFYVRGGKVVRVLEQVDIEGHEEFRRAKEGRRPRYFLEILEQVRQGRTREPIRVRKLAVNFTFPKQVRVNLPIEGALTATLADLFGPRGLEVARTEVEASEQGSTSTPAPGSPETQISPAPQESPAP